MNDRPTVPTEEQPPPQLDTGGGAKLIVPFLIIPLVIVVASVGVFLLFGQMAKKDKSALEYLEEMQATRSVHKRWQAAYALSGLLARGEFDGERAELEEEILQLLDASDEEEEQFRQYLILSLSQVGTEKSIPILKKRLEQETSENVKIFTLWTLGRIGSSQSAPVLRDYLSSNDPGYRKTAAYALGLVGSLEKDRKDLRRLLEDPIADVRWNAALALANLGDKSGETILLQLLDLERLKELTPNLRENERAQILTSAINAAGKLGLRSAEESLKKLAAEGPDVAVRQASRNALQAMEEENRQ